MGVSFNELYGWMKRLRDYVTIHKRFYTCMNCYLIAGWYGIDRNWWSHTCAVLLKWRGFFTLFEMSEKKRLRKLKFTDNEVNRLLDLIEVNYGVIKSKFSDQVTLRRKNECWKGICTKINAISPCIRTVEELKKRWDDMQGRSKKKANKARAEDSKTGNLPREEGTGDKHYLTERDRRVIGMMGTTKVYGIDGGFDTAEPDAIPPPVKKSKVEETRHFKKTIGYFSYRKQIGHDYKWPLQMKPVWNVSNLVPSFIQSMYTLHLNFSNKSRCTYKIINR